MGVSVGMSVSVGGMVVGASALAVAKAA